MGLPQVGIDTPAVPQSFFLFFEVALCPQPRSMLLTKVKPHLTVLPEWASPGPPRPSHGTQGPAGPTGATCMHKGTETIARVKNRSFLLFVPGAPPCSALTLLHQLTCTARRRTNRHTYHRQQPSQSHRRKKRRRSKKNTQQKNTQQIPFACVWVGPGIVWFHEMVDISLI